MFIIPRSCKFIWYCLEISPSIFHGKLLFEWYCRLELKELTWKLMELEWLLQVPRLWSPNNPFFLPIRTKSLLCSNGDLTSSCIKQSLLILKVICVFCLLCFLILKVICVICLYRMMLSTLALDSYPWLLN